MKPSFPSRFHGPLVLLLLLVGLGATDLHRAARQPFWFDEIITVTVARQASPGRIWAAVEKSVDSHPPLFHLLEHHAAGCWTDEHVGFRSLSIAAVLVAGAALFFTARPIVGDVGGLIAALLPLVTTLHFEYAIESRPYAPETAGVALALLLWWRSRGALGTMGLGLAVLLATSLHFYAIFAIAPLLLGESVRTWRRRTWDFATWAALLCGAAPLVVHWPLMAYIRQLFGPTFWSKLGMLGVPGIYDFLIADVDLWGTALLLPVACGFLLARRHRAGGLALKPEERTVIAGFLALPVVVVAVIRVAGGGMTARYLMPTVLGLALGLACLTTALGPKLARCVLALLVACAAVQATLYWTGPAAAPPALEKSAAESAWWRDAVRARREPAVPVVVSDGLRFLPESYYGALRGDPPVVFLLDSAHAMAFARSDSMERTLPLLAAYLPLKLRSLATIAGPDRAFFLLDQGNLGWPPYLDSLGYRLTVLRKHGRLVLYRVECPSPPRVE